MTERSREWRGVEWREGGEGRGGEERGGRRAEREGRRVRCSSTICGVECRELHGVSDIQNSVD